MAHTAGVYTTTMKNGEKSYRVSITYRRKHISLGSYSDESTAHQVYLEGKRLIAPDGYRLEEYNDACLIPHAKFVSLVNFRDNGIYFPTPIYLRKQYFEYYLSTEQVLRFDRDDLFFYAAHKIQRRGGYLFVSDYGSQYSILSRYGIKPFAVYGRDYVMINGDKNDYRYSNIRLVNGYIGVQCKEEGSAQRYIAQIHINGNYIIGRYKTETDAAIAYNKAVDTLHARGLSKAFLKNYILGMDKRTYAARYDSIAISDRIINYPPS